VGIGPSRSAVPPRGWRGQPSATLISGNHDDRQCPLPQCFRLSYYPGCPRYLKPPSHSPHNLAISTGAFIETVCTDTDPGDAETSEARHHVEPDAGAGHEAAACCPRRLPRPLAATDVRPEAGGPGAGRVPPARPLHAPGWLELLLPPPPPRPLLPLLPFSPSPIPPPCRAVDRK
jgi:hypothetical protein